MNTRNFAKRLVILTVLGLLAACGGDNSAPAPPVTVATITAQPTDQSVVAGTAATFSVVAGNATGYQWQSSTDGGTSFTNLSAATNASHTTAASTLLESGTKYRVVVAGVGNSVTSSAATLTVTAAVLAPSISVQPAAQTTTAGQNASFSVTAGGTSISYQWQRSTDGGASFTDLAGASNATLTLTAVALADNAQQFRVVVSNSAGSVTSNAATLTVNAAPIIPAFTAQPASATVVAPNTATFSAVATGTPGPTLQWQLSTNAGTSFADIVGATATSYTTPATVTGDGGKQYRVIATNGSGATTSTVATLTVNAATVAPAFTTQPASITITAGQNAQFTVAASGAPTPTLQWQLSTDNGGTWGNITGETGTTYTALNVALANNGRQFRAVASNGVGPAVNSNAAVLTVTALIAFPANARALSASDGVNGQELWMTDGTAAGTVLVKDINPGVNSSSPQWMTRLGSLVLFSAFDQNFDQELWRSDGTAAGTVRVVNLRTLGSSSPNRLTACNGSVFFGASGDTGSGLWKTDGTAAGTVLLASISVSTGRSTMACVNNVLFVGAYHATYGAELWRSDGSVGGTMLVSDIVPGVSDSSPTELVEFLGQLYFSAANGLWRSDGTASGTTLVSAPGGPPSGLTANGATLYFSAVAAGFGSEPWKSDGTPAGTMMIKDLNTQPGAFGGTLNSYPTQFTVSGGVTYFVAEPVSNSRQLWRTDGTDIGTFIVRQINPGQVATFGDSIFDFAGTLYFSANESGTGVELWKTDGTSVGTVLVRDILAGTFGSYPQTFMNVGGALLFKANDPVSGAELWRTDGTSAGTVLLKDICAGSCSSDVRP